MVPESSPLSGDGRDCSRGGCQPYLLAEAAPSQPEPFPFGLLQEVGLTQASGPSSIPAPFPNPTVAKL